jgi:hypothetical protein
MNNLTVAILHSSDDDPILRLYFSSKFLNETEFFCAWEDMWSSYDSVLLADFSLEWGFLRHPTSQVKQLFFC